MAIGKWLLEGQLVLDGTPVPPPLTAFTCQFWIPGLNKGSPPIKLPSLWGMRVQTESLLYDALWETLSLRLSRPISAPLLTAVPSGRYKEEKDRSGVLLLLYVFDLLQL